MKSPTLPLYLIAFLLVIIILQNAGMVPRLLQHRIRSVEDSLDIDNINGTVDIRGEVSIER